jgi:hypothetical protein
MRTITKMRLPYVGIIASVLLTALAGSPWVLLASTAVIMIAVWWFGPARCPRCGVIAGYREPRWWERHATISFRGICTRCGADFFEV